MESNTANADGLFSVATCALVSTYIAEQRPEGDTLGKWAEVAQVLSVGALILGLVVLAFALLIAMFGLARD